MFPLNTRQFSSTFLDFGRNSRGYAHEVRSADRDATKRLLSPVVLKDNNSTSSCRSIPLRHALGNTMWDFARRSTTLQCQSRNQNTGLNSHVYHWNSQEEGEGNIDDDEDDDDDDDEDDDATSFPGSSSKRSTLGTRLDVEDDIDDDDDEDDDATSFPGSSSKRSTLGTRLDVDDDIDDGDDDDFQFTPSGTDYPSHNSELSAVCFTSNASTCACVPLVCKTEDLSKEPYSEHTCTRALQGDITASTKVNEAANVTDSFNDTTAIGRDNCSNLQNGDSHFLGDAHVNCEVGTAKVHTCDDNARSSLTFNDDDDNVYYGSDNSSNGAPRNVKLQHVVQQANVFKEAKLGSNRCVLSEQEITQESMDNDLYLADGQCQNEKNLHNVHSEESVTCIPYTYSDTKEADVSNDYYQSDSSVCAKMDDSDELLHNEPCVKPLPLYKQGGFKTKTISPSLTLNLKLEVLKSVLHAETKFSRNDENVPVDICGKIAILSGFQEDGRSCISVLESEVVGQYDYIAGLVHVHPLGQHGYEHQADDVVYENIKDPLPPGANMSVDLSTFLEQSCRIPQAPSHTAKTGTVLKEYSPVAWLLTSPALGVMLDWQVQEKLLTCAQQMACDKSCDEQHESETSQWYNVLVVVDEYRCVEKDTPLIEVYELCGNGIVNLVNFDLN